MLENNFQYNGTAYHLLIDFKKAYGSVISVILYAILLDSAHP
jgi:hypothetical protein